MLVLALVLVFAVPGLDVKKSAARNGAGAPRRCAQRADGVRHRGGGAVFRRVHRQAHAARPRRGRAAVWWCVRICVLVTLLSAFTIDILGAELTAKLNHPFFTMLRNVSLFHAVERFGALVIGLWVLPDFVLVSMLLTLAVNCLRAAGTHDGRLFAQKNPPALVLLCAAAAGAGALFLAQNAFETDALQTNIVPIVNIVLLGIGTVGMYLVGRARENLSAKPSCRKNHGFSRQNLHLFAACGRQTLRGFLTQKTTPPETRQGGRYILYVLCAHGARRSRQRAVSRSSSGKKALSPLFGQPAQRRKRGRELAERALQPRVGRALAALAGSGRLPRLVMMDGPRRATYV